MHFSRDMRAACPTHLTLVDVITRVTYGEGYELYETTCKTELYTEG